VGFQIFRPSDVWLQGHTLSNVGAGPELTIKDLKDPQKNDSNLQDFSIVFQRSIWSWNAEYGPETVQFFFDVLALTPADVTIINPPLATMHARRKHVALALLAKAGVPVLPFFASPNPIRNMNITRNLGTPAVVKTLEGAGGIGVLLAPSAEVYGDVISLFYRNRHVPLVQPFVPVDHDLRILVLGDHVLGAIRRKGPIHKHNIALGAKPQFVPSTQIPPEAHNSAVNATRVLGLEIAGVDILETDAGPLILEVNPSPGFSGFMRASGINIPAKIVSHLRQIAHK
jgi:ribosomal protein S6--L-glutamate ligase